VYDAGVERVGRICKHLRRYLPHIQNSVFEGELPESKLAAMTAGLEKLMDTTHDSALLWVMRDVRWTDRKVIGIEKRPVDTFF
jgi:CRISPR-associated protein Cas2